LAWVLGEEKLVGTYILIGIAAVPVILAIELFWNRWRTGRFFCTLLPRRFRDRSTQQAAWDDRYQHNSPPEVEHVLDLICDIFAFHPGNRYQFSPEDRLLDIYRACYPSRWAWLQGDCMEIESLMIALDIEAAELNPDASLGDLVELTIRGKNKRAK